MAKLIYLYVTLVILFWSSSAAVGKLVLTNLDNFQVLFYTTLVASITLLLIVLLQKKGKIIKNYSTKDYLTLFYMGCLGIFIYYLFYFGSLMLISAQETMIINYLWPMIIVILAIFILKEKFSIKKLIAIILSFIGVLIVISKGDLNFNIQDSLGVLFAFLAAVSYGLFSVLGKKQNYDVIVATMFYNIFSFIITLITIIAFGKLILPNLFELMGLLWLGVFPGGIAYVFWFLALKQGDTSKISNFMYLNPFVSLVYIYLLVGEKILLSSVIGLLFIIGGIMLQVKKD